MQADLELEKGSFYKGLISRIEPSLEAAFVDFGRERHGFLPFSKIEGYDKKTHKEGSFILVRVEQPETDIKAAALSAPKSAPTRSVIHELLSEKSSKGFPYLAAVFVFVVVVLGLLLALKI